MSYYQYMQSVYRSCLPQLNRSLRSSSVERSLPLANRSYYSAQMQDNSYRYMRASTVGPTDYVYTSAMPFALEAEKAAERLMARRRAQSVENTVVGSPFTYTMAYQTGGTGYSAFDYKVGQPLICLFCGLCLISCPWSRLWTMLAASTARRRRGRTFKTGSPPWPRITNPTASGHATTTTAPRSTTRTSCMTDRK